MKSRFFISVILGLLACHSLLAQQAALDDSARLMQEYMVRRAEWVEARRVALDQIKSAKNESEKKQIKDKLAKDEEALLAKMSDASRAYKQALKQKINASAKPRT